MERIAKSAPRFGHNAIATLLSVLIALLMTGTSLAGILLYNTIYPTQGLLTGFLSNDVVNLVIGLPVLIVCMLAARRGSVVALLCWPGALLYIFYNSLIYSLTMPFSWFYPAFPLLALLSLITFILLILKSPGQSVKERLENKVAEKWTGGLMVGLGLMYLVRAALLLIKPVSAQTLRLTPETATQMTDLVVMLLWVYSGIQLFRHRIPGYLTGLAVLFQAVTLFIGLMLYFLLQPWLSGTPIPVTDLLVILVMSLAAIIPFAHFLRGAAKKSN